MKGQEMQLDDNLKGLESSELQTAWLEDSEIEIVRLQVETEHLLKSGNMVKKEHEYLVNKIDEHQKKLTTKYKIMKENLEFEIARLQKEMEHVIKSRSTLTKEYDYLVNKIDELQKQVVQIKNKDENDG